jgi:hypothetical protein
VQIDFDKLTLESQKLYAEITSKQQQTVLQF